ncbi:MAG: SDR family NAD(P)-dependent oxidoreductase [Myxococcota bacterium]|nr:SDR family NAD(P)-dependent oxidoreductase [Myxococcota bacterium]
MAWSKKWAGWADKVLDPTVIWSFSQAGYHRHSAQFEPQDLKVDLSHKRILVTGANSGIGKATAQKLAALGASVVMLCRSKERGQQALEEIQSLYPHANLELILLDVSSLKDIRTKAPMLASQDIDILIHNAGVLPSDFQNTPEGLELTLATNLIGPHLLTQLLLHKLKETRVIWVSSGGMYPVKIDLELLEKPPQDKFDGVAAYAQTKRAQVILSELYAKQWPETISLCMHPGWADTPAVKSSIPTFYKVTKSILRTPEQGADTVIWLAALMEHPKSGTFWFDRQIRTTHAFPWTRESQSQRQALWDMCNRLIAQ